MPNSFQADPDAFRADLLARARRDFPTRLRRRTDPEEVAQLAVVQAWESIDQFRGATAAEFVGWLQTILDRVIAQQLRTHAAQRRDVDRERAVGIGASGSSMRLAEILSDSISTPSAKAIRQEQVDALTAAIDDLPDAERSVVEARFLRELTIERIADECEMPKTTVLRVLTRALARLQSAITE